LLNTDLLIKSEPPNNLAPEFNPLLFSKGLSDGFSKGLGGLPTPGLLTTPSGEKPFDNEIAQKAQALLQQQQLNATNQHPPSRKSSLTPTPPKQEKGKPGRKRRPSVTRRKSASKSPLDLSTSTLADLLKSRSPILSPSHTSQTPSASSSSHMAALASGIGMSNLAAQMGQNKQPAESLRAPVTNPLFNQVIANMIQQQQRAQKPPTAEDIQRQAKMILEQSKLNSINKPQLTPPSAQSLQSLLASTATPPAIPSAQGTNLLGNNPFWGGLRNIFSNNDNTTPTTTPTTTPAPVPPLIKTDDLSSLIEPTVIVPAADVKPTVKSEKKTERKPSIATKPKPTTAAAPPTTGSTRGRSKKSKGQRLEANLEKIRSIRKEEEKASKHHKIVHSPNVREITTLETPSGTITLTPTKKMAKSLSASKRKNTTPPAADAAGKPPKRSRGAPKNSPVQVRAYGRNRSGSPMNPAKALAKARKGRLPKLRLSRKIGEGESIPKWRIEHVFTSNVTDAEIDCTPILDRRSRKRANTPKMTPPPLQRAPGTAAVPPSDQKSPAARILPTLSPAPSNPDLDSVPPPSNHQPVRLKIRLSRNNNRPTVGTLRSTPRKAKAQVKYTVDSWWDEN